MSDKRLTIAIGADHGGFPLKEHLRRRLSDLGHTVEDCGSYDGSPCDYPVIAAEVAKRVSDHRCERGILIDGAGIGSSMVANKFAGVRAALCYDVSSAKNSREHNNANVLTLGAGLIGSSLAEQIVETWLAADCTVERHQKRVAMIDEIDQQHRAAHECECKGKSMSKPAENPSAISPLKELPGMSDLSDAELERIAARIVELAGGSRMFGAGEKCACCGTDCRGCCASRNPGAMKDFLDAGAHRIGHGLGVGPITAEVARHIDHTLLKPEATSKQIEQLCREAMQHSFASVCINPSYVRYAASLLKGSPVVVCTVVGFPLGAHVAEIKAMEARRAIRDGAKEIDMVINIGALKSGDDETVLKDIQAVVDACVDGRAICKVIIECALLSDEEKVRACLAAKRARADFVKTSTGFASGGATVSDVALMSETVRGTRMGVKAAGGIRNYDDFKAMVAAGATRIGASAGVAIVKEAKGGAPARESKTPAAKPAEKY